MTVSTAQPRELESQRFRQVMSQYPTGVCVVTAIEQTGEPVGLTIGSFASVSLLPQLIAFMPDRGSSTGARIRKAGTFCVNVLSADQEELCRQFASRREDKFAGVAWTAAGSGAPILDGALAWIDCDVQQVVAAGDHDIVIGRVRALDETGAGLPLLFHRGGYGRFHPSTMVANDGDLAPHLHVVDLARAEMDTLARGLPGQIVAVGLVANELVLLGSAGDLEAGTTWSRVGERLPAIAPIGAHVAAWQSDAVMGGWLAGLDRVEDRDRYREQLERTRRRGYSVMLQSPYLTSLTEVLDRRGLGRDYSGYNADQRSMLANLTIDPASFTADQAAQVSRIYVPILATSGPRVVLGIRLARPPHNAEEFERYVHTMQRAAARVSRRVRPSTIFDAG